MPESLWRRCDKFWSGLNTQQQDLNNVWMGKHIPNIWRDQFVPHVLRQRTAEKTMMQFVTVMPTSTSTIYDIAMLLETMLGPETLAHKCTDQILVTS